MINTSYGYVIDNWTNKKLVSACASRDTEARKVLYDKYASQMYSVCMRYAQSKEDANDIFQEGFLSIYEKIEQLRNSEALSGWIKRVFVNTALEFNRNKTKLSLYEDAPSKHEISLGPKVLEKLALSEITDMIMSLPAGCRMVFNLYVIDGFSHKEIANALSISVGTSKSQLFEARKLLKNRIKKKEKTHLAKQVK